MRTIGTMASTIWLARVFSVFLAFFLAVSFFPNPAFPRSLAEAGEGEVFSWRQASGQTLRVMLNKHPYADGITRRLRDFEELTGIKVAYIIYPEASYFPNLDEAFDSESGKPDVYMTGVYQAWEYAPRGQMMPLDSFLVNPVVTRQGYNINDFFPSITGAFRWNCIAGAELGDGPLWAIPIGFESSALLYNREIFARLRLPVPRSMEDLIDTGRKLREFEGPGTYGVAARGTGEWGSLHSGYITLLANYGAMDMDIEDGRLVSRVNSPEAVKATEMWVRMLRECSAEDWENYDWYRCMADLGDRKAAMLLDSNVLGYFANNPGASSQSGKIGAALPPMPPGSKVEDVKSNLWVWGLAINPATTNQEAAWLFVQYFTSRDFQLYSVLERKSVNPPRRSVFQDSRFQQAISSMYGYEETFEEMLRNTRVYFTPTPYFFSIAKRWASAIRDIANGMYGSAQEGMDSLKIWMDDRLEKLPVESPGAVRQSDLVKEPSGM